MKALFIPVNRDQLLRRGAWVLFFLVNRESLSSWNLWNVTTMVCIFFVKLEMVFFSVMCENANIFPMNCDPGPSVPLHNASFAQTVGRRPPWHTQLRVKVIVKVIKLLYIVSNPQDCSQRFTVYSLADLFNQTTSHFLWEASSHTAINARRIFVHKYPPMSIARHSFIRMSKLEQSRVKQAQGLTRLHRIRSGVRNHCTTAPLRYYKITFDAV